MMNINSFKSQTIYLRLATMLCLAISISACKVIGPDYTKPTIDVPEIYKESGGFSTNKTNSALASARWWELYSDKELNF